MLKDARTGKERCVGYLLAAFITAGRMRRGPGDQPYDPTTLWRSAGCQYGGLHFTEGDEDPGVSTLAARRSGNVVSP